MHVIYIVICVVKQCHKWCFIFSLFCVGSCGINLTVISSVYHDVLSTLHKVYWTEVSIACYLAWQLI